MSTPMISIESAPRDVASLQQLKRGVLYRIGMQLDMFTGEDAEQGFLGATIQDQAQAVATALAQRDAANGGPPQAAAPAPTAPVAAMPPAAPTFGVPAQPPGMPAPAMAPAMPAAPAPAQMGLPAMPAVAPPPQAAMVPQPAAAPQMPPAAPMAPPAIPTAPAMPAPPQPTMPAAPAAPLRSPVTTSDPTNAGQVGTLAAPQTGPVAVGNLAPLIKGQAGIIQALKEIADAEGKRQEWIEELHDQTLANTRILHTLLLTLFVLAEQSNIDPEMLAKLALSLGEDVVGNFLQHFDEDEEGKD